MSKARHSLCLCQASWAVCAACLVHNLHVSAATKHQTQVTLFFARPLCLALSFLTWSGPSNEPQELCPSRGLAATCTIVNPSSACFHVTYTIYPGWLVGLAVSQFSGRAYRSSFSLRTLSGSWFRNILPRSLASCGFCIFFPIESSDSYSCCISVNVPFHLRPRFVRPDLTQSISILSYGRPIFSFNLLSFIFFPWEGQRLFSFARIFK